MFVLPAVLVANSLCTGVADADPPPLSDLRFLQGDEALGSAVEVQDFVQIAAGGGGYLAIWQDQRTVLTGFSDMEAPLTGNERDIYAARLDGNGNLLSSEPIVISQEGRNQTRPRAAWNEAAQAWLVVWTTQRPDWYFFQDIVGARISLDGSVLDPEPIPLRLQNDTPANDYGQSPCVASDGHTWAVAWQDTHWSGGIGYPQLAGKRVDAGGSVLDADPVVLYQWGYSSFGPIQPQLAWAADEYLLVWEASGYYDLVGRRITAGLQPLGADFVITTSGYGPRVATDGTDFLVSSRYLKVHRVTHAGVSLDPGGIDLPVPGVSNDQRGPDVTWAGSRYLVATAQAQYPNPIRVYLVGVEPNGTAIPPAGPLLPSPDDQYLVAIGSAGNGHAQVAWSGRNISQGILDDIQGTRVNGSGTPGSEIPISRGWPRQSYVRFTRNGDQQLAVYLSQGGGLTRILAQRVDLDGNPIDLEPVEVGTAPEVLETVADAAWNGNVYLVTWALNGTVYARRLGADLTPVDPAPVQVVSDAATSVGVGALGANFLLAYPHTFSGDQRDLKGIVLGGADLAPIGSPLLIGGSFVQDVPRVAALGDRWLLAWTHRPTHDSPASNVLGAFVSAGGAAGPVFAISGSGYGNGAALAIGDGQALVAWSDDGNYGDAAIEGRLVAADGSLPGTEFLISNALRDQILPACGWDGTGFVVAWNDYRNLGQVDQLRGDIYAARVGADGLVQDPGGFAVTSGSLPEDLAAVTGGNGRAVIAFSALHGAVNPYVQRIGYRGVGFDPAGVTNPPANDGGIVVQAGPNPFRNGLTITFTGPASPVERRLEVYSTSGRLVRAARVREGDRSLRWDGRDDSGHVVSNGTYFLRILEGESTLSFRSVVKID